MVLIVSSQSPLSCIQKSPITLSFEGNGFSNCNKRFIFSEKVSWWSPGFDLNDVGYLLMADVVENLTTLGIRQTEPKKLMRNYTLTLGQRNSWNYGGLSTYNDLNLQFKTQFTNRMDLSLTESYVFSELESR